MDGGIDPRLVLAHAASVEYDGVTTGIDWTRLQAPDDGYMDEVHTLRNGFSTDLVYLLKTGGGTATRLLFETLKHREAAFAVTTNRSEEMFPHEVGYNLGLRHDRYARTRAPKAAADPV